MTREKEGAERTEPAAAGAATGRPSPASRPVDRANPPGVLAQFYRSGMSRADTWRQRLDATTNWAVVTTAAMITFVFGGAAAPHYVLLLALVFDCFFLLMESRRYQHFNLWQRRLRAMNRFMIVPALAPEEGPDDAEIREGMAWIARELGKTVPYLGLMDAAGYRIRRNYGPLVTLVLLCWAFKLWVHPEPLLHLPELVDRAAVGPVAGRWVLLAVATFFLAFVILAVRAPSEQIMDWSRVGTPLKRAFDERAEEAVEERKKERKGRAPDAKPPGMDA